jgi:NADPH:quinone reductase-like Zn-dependent oxidoreductase
MHGAQVIATASHRDRGLLMGLGAHEVIDFRTAKFEDFVRDVDVVVDTVGGETLARSWQVLKPSGRMVTVASSEDVSNDERIKEAFFIVEPKRDQLERIATLLDEGKLHTFVAVAVPFEQAPDAYAGRISKPGPGKIVVNVAG